MSIFKVYPEDSETRDVVVHPHQHYISSSLYGTTGSLHVYPRASSIEKGQSSPSSFIDQSLDDSSAVGLVEKLKYTVLGASGYQVMDSYMTRINSLSMSSKNSRVHEISRFNPSLSGFDSSTSVKLHIKDVLNSYYRVKYPSAHWNYTNFNSLCFFTASNLPEDAVLLYPNIGGVAGQYTIKKGFTFDFYINPRYRNDEHDTSFKAGTILHLTSSYALSLISGSRKDENGRPDSFRLLLQLSSSADVIPSLAVPGLSSPDDLIFSSSDCLDYDTWSHVVVRWGTNLMDKGVGSFLVDSGSGFVERGTFDIPSSSIAPTVGFPDVLCLGNFYEGSNSGNGSISLFFSTDTAKREGLVELATATAGVDEPDHYTFGHPLNADLHDVSIIDRFVDDDSLLTQRGSRYIDLSDHIFFVPPLFLRESPVRTSVMLRGGIMQSPFFEMDGTTADPFNVALSFNVGGHDINLENFVKDIANDLDPRCLNLTGSALTGSTDVRTANEFLWDQPSLVKRNLLLLPCDDGNFVPDFSLMTTRPHPSLAVAQNESSVTDDGLSTEKYVDDLGVLSLGQISLDNMVDGQIFGSNFVSIDSNGLDVQKNDYADSLIGHTPENPAGQPGSLSLNSKKRSTTSISDGTLRRSDTSHVPYTIFQRTGDGSSNEVVIFNISSLFYGDRILPRSFVMSDSSLSGSSGVIGVTLKDDGSGGLYRADSSHPASWNVVGNIYYEEGIVVIKSPHLFQFGREQFDVSFRGERSIHIQTLSVLAPSNTLNDSTNQAFQPVPATLYPNDNDRDFVYISGINFHDENMNVVMRTALAQPIIKRTGDRFLFKCKIVW